LKLAQGILCGSWALAFSFDWARQIVDDFQLSPLPKSPPWLLGAANVDGTILPVVDLAVYLGVTNAHASQRKPRLLIGGLGSNSAAEADADGIAICFEGLPQQLGYEPRDLTYASALPPRLREICTGVASDATGREYLEIDATLMLAALSDELSQT
jgi:chemotaxis signal transduction protein